MDPDVQIDADIAQIPLQMNPGVQIDADIAQIPTSYGNLPPEILAQIFNAIPAKDRLPVAAVCWSWRSAFLGTSACWTGIHLGRNSNCYLTSPPQIRRADYFPLCHVQEVLFTPAIPAVVRDAFVSEDPNSLLFNNRFKDIPYPWLSLVLTRAPKLKKLDLTKLFVRDEYAVAFRFFQKHSFISSCLFMRVCPLICPSVCMSAMQKFHFKAHLFTSSLLLSFIEFERGRIFCLDFRDIVCMVA